MGNRISQLKAGAFLSYAQMALNIFIGILYTPVMLRILGQSEYGLYNTVASTISTMSILSLGLNSGYVRYFSKYKKDNDTTAIYKLNGLFILIFSVIGLITIVCGLFLTANLNFIFDDGLTQSEYSTARVLMVLLTASLAISFPAGIFSHIISANERFIFLKVLGMVKTVIGPLVTLPLLLMGYGSIGMVSASLFVSVVTDAIYFYYVIKVLKHKFYFRDFEKGIFKSLFAYTGFIALNLIAEQINHSVDKVLISRYLGTEMTAVYAIGYTLYTYYTNFSLAISGVFTPRVHNVINATEDNKSEQHIKLTELFVKVGRVQFIILALLASGIFLFGKEFILFWAGAGYEQSYYVVLLLVIPAVIPLTQNIGIAVQRAMNNHQFRGVVYFIMSIINLVLTIILTPVYGVVGATIGTAISLVIGNIILMNTFYHKKCNINILVYWKNILMMLKGLVLPVVLGLLVKKYVSFNTISLLVGGIAVYCCIYVGSMWLFALNKYEKGLLLGPVKKVLKR